MFSLEAKMKKTITIGIILLMVGSAFMAFAAMPGDTGLNAALVPGDTPSKYVSISPFRIDSNSDMDSAASSYGWLGDGSQSNPYLIEGYEIDAGGAGAGIYIGNVTRFFIISDCYIYGADMDSEPYYPGAAIALYNTEEVGRIQYTNTTMSEYSVYLSTASANSIDNITSTCDNGIYLNNSDDVRISSVDMRNEEVSIHLQNCSGVSIIGGNILTNSVGVLLEGSEECDVSGLSMDMITDLASSLIKLTHSDKNRIFNNTLEGHKTAVMYDYYGFSNEIYGNTVRHAYYGIHAYHTEYLAIHDNDLENNTYGVESDHSRSLYAGSNNIYNSSYGGIYLYYSDYALVEGNNISCGGPTNRMDYTDPAIKISGGSGLNISNNDIHDNRGAMKVEYCENSTIYGNRLLNNDPYYNVDAESLVKYGNGVVFKGNTIDAYHTGVKLYSGAGHVVVGNTISVRYYGVDVSQTENYTIYGNNITSNNYGIYVYGPAPAGHILNNTVDSYGFFIRDVDMIHVENNTLHSMHSTSNMPRGLGIYHSTNATVRNNAMDRGGITLDGRSLTGRSSLEYWDSHTIEGNTIAGKPISYIKNDEEWPSSAGQYIFVNCWMVSTIHDEDIHDVYYGVTIAYSYFMEMSENNVENVHTGVFLFMSDGVNIITNNFINYTYPVTLAADPDYSGSFYTHLDGGYGTNGNYYSDEQKVDEKRGTNQDEPGGDGVSDIPYTANTVNYDGDAPVDKYPLMRPNYMYHYPEEYPMVVETSPSGVTGNSRPTIWARVVSADDCKIDAEDIDLYVNGYRVRFNSTEIVNGQNVSYTHRTNFSEGKVTCRIVAKDLYSRVRDESWNFTIDLSAPYIADMSPAAYGYSGNNTPVIWLHILDNYSGLDLSSITLIINDYDIDYDVSPIPGGYNISYWHEAGFNDGDNVRCRIVAKDSVGWRLEYSWNFTVGSRISTTYSSGWNTVSLPWLDEPVDIESALSGASWDRAMLYIDGTWYTYNRNRDAKYNAGFPTVDSTSGILVDFTAETTISGNVHSTGNTIIELHSGWNLVGYPSSQERTISDAMSGIPYQSVKMRNGTDTDYRVNPDDVLVPGMSYWIYVDEDCEWTVEW